MAKDPAGTAEVEAAKQAADKIIAAAKTEANQIIADAKTEATNIKQAAQEETTAEAETSMTIEEAAACVKRIVAVPPKEEGGKATTKAEAITADEVLSFKDCGDHVIVVTKDGQKFSGPK